MGFRFRKSFKSGPFKVTFSKSGVGYSIGGKGFRVTKKARGGIRTTASIPGTGLSYTSDFGGKRKKSAPRQNTSTKRSAVSSSAPILKGRGGSGNNFCSKCGAPLSENSKFCAGCGGSVNRSLEKTVVNTPVYKKWWFWVIIVLAASILSCVRFDGGAAGSNPTPSTVAATEASTPTEAADPYATVDKFIELYNSIGVDPIADLAQMDIHGADHKTEFRLDAFNNAVGKKGSLPSGTVEIINFGAWERNEFRVYASLDSLDEAIELYENTVKVCGGTTSDQLPAAIKHNLSVTSSVNLGGYASITGYINTRNKNGGISGYDIMLEGNTSDFS